MLVEGDRTNYTRVEATYQTKLSTDRHPDQLRPDEQAQLLTDVVAFVASAQRFKRAS